MPSPSRATVRVPAAGPYNSTAAKTNVSETEIDAGTEGSLTVADPLMRVSAARRNHCQPTGFDTSWYTEVDMTPNPRTMMAVTYARPFVVRRGEDTIPASDIG